MLAELSTSAEEVLKAVQGLTALTHQIYLASEEQATSAGEFATAMDRIRATAQANTGLAAQLAQAGRTILEQSEQLEEVIRQSRAEVVVNTVGEQAHLSEELNLPASA